MYASGPARITIASPIGGVFHCPLFRATWPRSAPHGPSPGRASGPSHTSGSIVAMSPSLVAVIRFAARPEPSKATTEASSGLKWAGTYILAIIALAGKGRRDSARLQRPPEVERPLPVGRVLEHDPDRRAGTDDGRVALEDADLDTGAGVGGDLRPTHDAVPAMVDRVGPEVATELLDEARPCHRSGRGTRRNRRQRDVLTGAAAPPLLGCPSFREGPGDLQHPALVTDRHGRPTIADLRRVRSVTGAVADLVRHRILDAREVEKLGPCSPRIAQVRIVWVGLGQQPVDLVEQHPFGLHRRSPPTNVGPHQAQRAIEQVLAVGRICPPGRDVGRDPRVRHGDVEPAEIARAERGMDRALEVIARVRREADRDRTPEARAPCTGVDERAAEPIEVAPLGTWPLSERHAGRIALWIIRLLNATLPADREVVPESFEDAAHEPVVPGASDI